jgi:NDP-sugar pyrophosphorylase family protein
VVLASPTTVTGSLAAGLQGAEDDEIVLFGFPDTIWEPEDGYVRLLEALEHPYEAVLGLFEGREPERSDVVSIHNAGRVTAVDVKPSVVRSPWVWGCSVCRVRAFAGATSAAELGTHWNRLAGEGLVRGVTLSEVFIDIGTKEALATWGDDEI